MKNLIRFTAEMTVIGAGFAIGVAAGEWIWSGLLKNKAEGLITRFAK